ncbi:cation-independent mannose-6-phosphate receptor-like [Mizuhopecten yessoensis]|uniref:Cation-independent mannose-6-phosphate receptor n=1 Tax=Mizuhopecten yessoensis TaxID=6573 RepID=A0A210QUQ9_MIZYE|nr:cation-independent mannose-6-phosphate receptor-like [Mizuhopecten yessoensis]OWF52457.1 Cation-independent mannose-6-phosphate receptor [Mizuhopecten yessoensis]
MAAAISRKKTNAMFCLRYVFSISFLLAISLHGGYCDQTPQDCVFGGSDFSLIKQFNPWPMLSEDGNTTYQISLCEAIKPHQGGDCHDQTSICRTVKGESPKSSGNFTHMAAADNTQVSEQTLVFQGDACPDVVDGHYVTMITFQCSLNVGLGSPEFLVYSLCTTYVLWRTNVVCNDTERAVKEVPCYVYDHLNQKHNLAPLTKKDGGYLVSSEAGWNFYINVCKDIKGITEIPGGDPDEKTKMCPPGAGACQINTRGSGTALGMGDPKDKLQVATGENKFLLRYTTDETVNGCTAKPSTSIEFRCPSVGGGKDPVMVADFNCQFRIVWETEHACAEVDITNKTCRLVKESENIDIDLSPLRVYRADRKYQVTVPPSTKGGDYYIYYLNVCGELGIQCPDMNHVQNVAACQTKSGDSDYGRVIGSVGNGDQRLRYADGDLTLTYRGGDICHKNNPRTTIINFKCDPNTAVNMGKGYPTFVKEVNDSCIYMFDWATKYACSGHPANEECRVDYNGKRYDLSPLTRRHGHETDWEVLHSDGTDAGKQFYLNVCNDLLNTGGAASCHPDASVCLIDHNGPHNLGSFIENPVFSKETNALQITYGNGEPCGDKKRTRSIIDFICKPGDLESGPVLMDTSLDSCLYRFEWHTSAACVLGHWRGDNCHVFDKEAGFNFDLSPLTLKEGSYSVTDTNKTYEYHINVCDAVHNTSCDTSKSTPPNAGVCQTKSGDHAINTGTASSILEYYDGMINLTYTNGQVYNSHPPVPRKTEIVFLCDTSAGKGKPSFISESSWGYSFEWYTAYACPNEPVECTVTDPARKQQYDLSSLSKSVSQDNWELLDDSDPKNKLKYYINVCRPLSEVHVGKGCSTFGSACRTSYKTGQEAVDIADLGSVVSPPVVEREGQLSLKYRTKDKICDDINGNGKTTITTSIHFICSRGAMVTGPSTVTKLGNCDYVYMWATEAACPLEMTEATTNCSVKDRNSDYVFNLGLLTRKSDTDYYDVKDGAYQFRINICGVMSPTHCPHVEGKAMSLCRLLPNSSTEGLSFLKYTLDYDDDGKLMLKYEGKRLDSGIRIEVRVLFLCRQNVDIGEPKFDRVDEGYKYIFTFETSLACKPDPIDCLAEDIHGNRFDLSPLARGAGDTNWQVTDTHSDHKNTYHINVCRPINTAGTSCQGGPIGGCGVSSIGDSFNMGYIHSQPIAAEDGTVTLHYRNGDICNKNKTNESRYSTRILFSCSGVERNPTFMGKTDSCEYLFSWQTPFACPMKKPHIGSDCKVQDPLATHEFDLNPLRKATDYKVPTPDNYLYILNVCGPLQSTTACGADQVGICQTKPSNASYKVNAGMPSSALRYQTGVITLKYLNGKSPCHGKYNRSTIITFLCDHSTNGSAGPVFIKEESDCTYMFEWKTSLACPPFKEEDCSITAPNHNQYDLSTLALTSDNYDYLDYIHNKKFIINVCRSLVHKKDQTCPYNAAVCMVDLTQQNDTLRFHNLGEVNKHQVIVDNGQLELHYTNGEQCSSGGRTSTRIIMYCDKTTLFSHPVGHFTVNNCEHEFTWSTQAACPLNTDQDSEQTGNCTARNPVTGHVFDLSSLNKGTPYKIDDHRGHIFKLNVCGKVTGSGCAGVSVGACQEEVAGDKRNFSSGLYNSKLQFDNGVLVLNYHGGKDCHNKMYKRTTIINFVCSQTAGEGNPVFIDESDDCTYYLSWHTSLACEKEVKCSVDAGNRTIDLSPLVKPTGEYSSLSTMNGKDVSYYINICRPLNPIYGTLCPPQASACMLQPGGSPQSLGKVTGPPVLEKGTGKVTLIYEGGDVCSTNQAKNMSTKIVFVCNPGVSRSGPVLQEVSDCQYVFVWDTSVVCSQDDTNLQPVANQDCSYKDAQTGNTYNLTYFKTLQKREPMKKNGFSYSINVCDKVETALPGCETAGVCRTNNTRGVSYGSVAHRTVSKTGKVIQLTYTQGDTCGENRKRESVITFDCDTSGKVGQPKYTYAGQCQALFYWRTCVVCPKVADACSLGYNYKSYDLSMLSSETGGWNLTDAKGNRYWINICQSVNNGPTDSEECPHMVAAWRQTPSGLVDRLGLISTQKLTMDTDEKTLILQYFQGDTACSNTKRRSDNSHAQTLIKFVCGNTVGGPVFIERDNQGECVFEFHWKSKVACSLISQTVKDKDGAVKDPETGGVINLNKLGSSNVRVSDTSYYELNPSSIVGSCTDSVVCLHDTTSTVQNIGAYSKRKFSFEDGMLEAEYESDKICVQDRKKNVKAIITFHCNDQENSPILLSRSKDCVHMFLWETPVACLHPKVVIDAPIDSSKANAAAAAASKGKTIGTVMAVFSSAILVCVLLIVFHKKERRDSCLLKLRSVVKKDTEYRYSMLPDAIGNEEYEDILGAANNTAEPDEPREVNTNSIESEPKVESYHDDSDVDLLE